MIEEQCSSSEMTRRNAESNSSALQVTFGISCCVLSLFYLTQYTTL